jgi:hypothetical protein
VKDRREHRAVRIYMLNPEKFVLPDLVSSNPQHKPRDSFKAKGVFREHLERDDGISIFQDVDVSVKRVTIFGSLIPRPKSLTSWNTSSSAKGRNSSWLT